MNTERLGPVSYLILGLLVKERGLTPYDMKKRSEGALGAIWSFPHAQLYSEPTRLVELGLLNETRELEGRRRRTFNITTAGRKVFKMWLSDVVVKPPEIRNLALLKLFFAEAIPDDPMSLLATSQIDLHAATLQVLNSLDQDRLSKGEAALVRLGITINQAYVDFWRTEFKE